jgi:hypothetical protein
MATTPSFELFGRNRELSRLEDVVGQLGEGPRAVLIRGEPGIGKTAVWREAAAAARHEGVLEGYGGAGSAPPAAELERHSRKGHDQ